MQENPIKETSKNIDESTIDYVTLLLSLEVMLNTCASLEGTRYFKSKVQSTVNNTIKTLSKYNSTNNSKLWQADEEQVAKMMWSIHIIAKAIAEDDGTALTIITNLTREGLDLSRCVIKELNDEELKKLQDGNEGK